MGNDQPGRARIGPATFPALVDHFGLGEQQIGASMRHVISSAEIVYKRWTTVRRLELKGQDGRMFLRDLEDHGSASVVFPYDPVRRTAIVVEQSRHPRLFAGEPEMSLEPIAGRIDDGESAEDAARREALEEAGLRVGPLEKVVVSWSMPAISTEQAHLFFATYTAADRVAEGGGLEHEDEQIIVHELALGELAEMARRGELTDAKLHLLVLALQVARPDLFSR